MSIPIERAGKGIYRGPRFNKNPALIGGALIVLFLLGLYYAGEKRNSTVNQRVDSSTAVYNIDAEPESTIDLLTDKPDGLAGINHDKPRESIGDAVSAQDRMADTLAELLENQKIDSLRVSNERRAKYETAQIQAYEEAIRSTTEVSGFGADLHGRNVATIRSDEATIPTLNSRHDIIVPARAVGNSQNPENTLEGINADQFRKILQSPQAKDMLAAVGIDDGLNHLSSTNTGAVDAANNFISTAGRPSRFELEASSETPRSPYEIKTGTLISGAMISATNSDLPGDIVAQVTKNVYDTASGRYLVIPQGTKLFGRYDAYVALGQNRLVIVWDRLIFPDAETLDIGGMQGYDARGLSGFSDRVNTHFLRTLGNAFLLSVVNATGEELVRQASEESNQQITINFARDFSDSTSTAFNEYLRNRLRIKPTLSIRAGYRFNIVVSRDIAFRRPYEHGFTSYSTRQ